MGKRRSDVEVIEHETVYEGYLKVHRYRLRHRLFSGGWSDELPREVLERAHVVSVLPYDPVQDTVVLVEQFRPAVFADGHDGWTIEAVAGLIENGEPHEDVARRETLEEAGLEIANLRRISGFHSSPGVFTEHVSIFVAHVDSRNAGGIHGLDHEHEDIRVLVYSFAESLEMLESGLISTSHTIVALQWLAMHRSEVRDCWR